jgi:hypothetical protein
MPSQRWIASIHEWGIKTGIRAVSKRAAQPFKIHFKTYSDQPIGSPPRKKPGTLAGALYICSPCLLFWMLHGDIFIHALPGNQAELGTVQNG